MKLLSTTIISILLLGTLLSTGIARAADAGTPTTGDGMGNIQKKVILRTVDGVTVPGITVVLAPADPELGGPPAVASVLRATTDEQGAALFEGLGRWVWVVTFSGEYQGHIMPPVGEQGRAPWGRTRAGNGFPVMLQRQEEDTSATPVTVGGLTQPEIQESLFVLVPAQDGWALTLDLALPGEAPQPLYTVPIVTSSPTETSTIASPISNSDAENDLSSFARWLYLLPAVFASFAVYTGWLSQKREYGKKVGQTSGDRVYSPTKDEEGVL